MSPQVTFRGVLPSEIVVAAVWRGADRLRAVAPQFQSCHVVIEAVARPARRRERFHVTVHVSGGARGPEPHASHATANDVLGALADAFDATHRDLGAQRGETLEVTAASGFN